MNCNEERAINDAAADGEQADERRKYVAIVVTSVARADEAEVVRNDIFQKLGGDGVTVSELGAEIRPLTDQEWSELREQLDLMDDDDDEEQTELKLGDRVKIIKGMREFVGRTGTVVDEEEDGGTTLYRVQLDKPAKVKGVGIVTDDLWAAEFLQVLS